MSADVISFFTAGSEGAAWHDPKAIHHHDTYPADTAQARRWAGQEWEWVEEPGFERIPVHWGARDPQTDEWFTDPQVPVDLGVDVEPVLIDTNAGRPYDPQPDDEVVNDDGGLPVAVYRTLTGERRILRSDTREHLITQLDSFEVVGVGEMWEFVKALAEQEHVKFEAGGVLKGSKEIWALARLDEPFQIPGDPSATYPFIAFLNSIDANRAAKALYTTWRVVCRNTWGAADAQGKATGHEYVFIHRPGVHDHLEQAKVAMKGGRTDWQAWQALATDLAQIGVTTSQREAYVQAFFPYPPGGVNTISKRVASNIETDRTALRNILDSDTCKELDDSVYKLVQGTGEWLDHVRGHRNLSTLVNRQVLRPEKQKARAITLAKKAAAGEL
jgi:phage/plasmid-like protein (TIGR03299 family)